MKRRKIRCYRGYGQAGGVYNIPVWFVVSETYAMALYSCINCGEIFFVNLEDPRYERRDVIDAVGEQACPQCGASLAEMLRPYPYTFRAPNGKLGTMDPGRLIPPESESVILELYDLEPSE